ncbi:hypothetical protein JCM3766R1_003474 [Sporobolomyces carnicolor]
MSVASSGPHYAPAVLPPHRTNNLPRSSHLSLQITHPAAFAADPEAEYSPLEAPALPFSSSGSPRRSRTRSQESTSRPLHTRPTSSSSLPSLAIHSSPNLSTETPSTDSTDSLASTASRRDMHGRGLSDAQEELLVEARNDRENGKDVNPYAWERPLDSVNRVRLVPATFLFFAHSPPAPPRNLVTEPFGLRREAIRTLHSRMLDSSPLATASDSTGRRVSRLPPGVQMLDPFGFNLAADTSPYDLALNASSPSATPGILSPSRSPVRASFLQPQLTPMSASASNSSHGHSPFPSSSSIASNLSNVSTAPTSPALQPWTKHRASSAGEVYQLQNRAQIKSGLLGPPVVQKGTGARSRLSKLSGEIEAETSSIASMATKSPLPAFVPADSDYMNSKLYARTLKAQKALEKERLKAASKGKMSRYDSEAAKSTSSLAIPRSSMDTGRPASIFSVASAGKVRTGRRSGLGWFKSSSEVALSPPTPDPPTSPSPPLATSRSSNALSLASKASTTPFHSASSNLGSELGPRSANYSSDYLREARESVVAQKAPSMSARQPSGSSSSSGGSDELVRPGPVPTGRKSRASPSGSFQQSPTIRESSPPATPPADDSVMAVEPQPIAGEPRSEASRPPATNLPPPVAPVSPPRPSRHSSLDATSRAASTTATSQPRSPGPPASVAHRVSSSTLKSPATPGDATLSAKMHAPGAPTTEFREMPAANGRMPPPAPREAPASRTSQTPYVTPSGSGIAAGTSRPRQGPTSPSKATAKNAASIVPPPLLTPDASLANGAEIGVKRRKSSLGLLFGGGGNNRHGKNAPVAAPAPAPGINGSEREKANRRAEGTPRKEAKPVVKEKVRDKVKESFFGRVKRPDPPEVKPLPTPAPRSRPPQDPAAQMSLAPRPLATSQPPPTSRLPPGAQPPKNPYPQIDSSAPALVEFPLAPQNGHVVVPAQRTVAQSGKAARAPDSSSSNSTTFSTLSSSSSTLPPTPSSGRSANGLSKSVNGSASLKPPGGGSAFANFFRRDRTKSLGPTASSATAQKLSRSKNTTPTPDDDRRQVPILPSKANYADRMSAVKKPPRNGGGPHQAFPGVENYAPPSANSPNDLLVTSHRGYPTYA